MSLISPFREHDPEDRYQLGSSAEVPTNETHEAASGSLSTGTV